MENFEDFDIDHYQKEVGNDFKLVYDVFCAYFIFIMEGKDKEKHIANLSKDNAIKIVNWLTGYVIPFYENLEDYEKCAKLKNIVEILRVEKSLA